MPQPSTPAASRPPAGSGRGDQWIRWTTTASVVLLAGIVAVVSYRHMHALALAHGESSWTATLIPLSVDGMVVASSMTLLADSRAGRSAGVLPWVLLAIASAARLCANVAVAEPTACGRVIAAWPSLALIGGAHAPSPAPGRCRGCRTPGALDSAATVRRSRAGPVDRAGASTCAVEAKAIGWMRA
jgi:Protein of unknown function (DUF2637)